MSNNNNKISIPDYERMINHKVESNLGWFEQAAKQEMRKKLLNRIDDLINKWHNSPYAGISLNEYLGMSFSEYAKYVEYEELPEGYKIPINENID